MTKIYLCVFTIILLFQNVSAQNEGNRDLEILTKEVILFREKCLSDAFSFCGDGYEQPYRMYPYFVLMDSSSDDLNKIYKTGVFMFVPSSESETLLKKGIVFKNDWVLDSIFSRIFSKVIFCYLT